MRKRGDKAEEGKKNSPNEALENSVPMRPSALRTLPYEGSKAPETGE